MSVADPRTADVTGPQSLWHQRYLPLALGAVGLVTLGAFENRAVGTALPTLAREFGALDLFGVASAAPLASYVVSLAVAGRWADRSGPAPVLRAGVAAFALAQLLVATALTMPMVIAGRLLSGFAEGVLDVGLMVLIARALPSALRPKMFALFAAMWVLPSLLGPVLTGVLTETVGWRWVFAGALVLLVPTWLLIRPALRATDGRGERARDRRTATGKPAAPTDPPTSLSLALVAAAAVTALSLAGDVMTTHLLSAVAVVLVALSALGVTATRLLPAGSFRAAPGLPALVLLRGLSGAAFGGTGAWLPLLLTEVHGFGPTTAGISLSITGVMWASGSWLQSREHGLPRSRLLAFGMALMTVGLLVTVALCSPTIPPGLGLVGWAVAGIGMGLTSPTLSVLLLELSDDTNQGRNSGAAQMASSLSVAASIAVGGALVAFAAPAPGTATFLLILLMGALAAAAGLSVVRRVKPA
jgi:MFS family permease